MFGRIKKKWPKNYNVIKKSNQEEQRIRTASAQAQPPTIAEDAFYRIQSMGVGSALKQLQSEVGSLLYSQRALEARMMQKADQIRRAEHNKRVADLIDKTLTDELKKVPTRTLIQVDTGETRIYKNIGGKEVLVAHYENLS